jgi:hypothetical protein
MRVQPYAELTLAQAGVGPTIADWYRKAVCRTMLAQNHARVEVYFKKFSSEK